MTYAAQLEAKVGIIRDNLHRIGRRLPLDSIAGLHQFVAFSRCEIDAGVAQQRKRQAWTGVAPTPVLAEGDWRAVAAALEPADEVSGSAEYKRHLAAVLAARALARARV